MKAPPNVLDLDVWMRDNNLRQKVTLISMKFGRGSFISTRFIERSDEEIRRSLKLYTEAFSQRLYRKYWNAKVECLYDTNHPFVFRPDIVTEGITPLEADRLQQLLVYDIVDTDTFLQANPKMWYYEAS